MERGASPLSSVSYNLRLSIQGCLLEVFRGKTTSFVGMSEEKRGLGGERFFAGM